MAVITLIEVELYPRSLEKMLEIPKIVQVPFGQKVQWKIVPPKSGQFLEFAPFRFEVYFDEFAFLQGKRSPFDWQTRQKLISYREIMEGNSIIAEGDPQSPGQYKYGMRVRQDKSPEPLYDEDPILIIEPF